jgi:hypothetical protein
MVFCPFTFLIPVTTVVYLLVILSPALKAAERKGGKGSAFGNGGWGGAVK